jgi:hypothetical protein
MESHLTGMLLQDGVPELDLFGDENRVLKGTNPPAPSERKFVKEIII